MTRRKKSKRSTKKSNTRKELLKKAYQERTDVFSLTGRYFNARLHPRHPVEKLSTRERKKLYQAIVQTVQRVTAKGGRNDAYDLNNQPGGYARIMDKNRAGKPCPVCHTTVQKMHYLGKACYFCPACQT